MQLPSSMSGFVRSFRHLVRATLIATALIIPSGVSQASVLYNFVPGSMTTPQGAPYTTFSVVGSMELTDAAVASGSFGLADVTNFSFRVNNGYEFDLSDSPLLLPPYNHPHANGLVSSFGLLTSGSIGQLTVYDSLSLSGNAAGVWTGQFITDGSARGCYISNFPCQFTGTWEAVAVPEPASLALFGAACAAATLVSRRRRRSA